MNPNLASSSLTELASSWEPILAATFDRLLKLAHTLKPSTSLLGTPESSSDLSSPPVSNSNIFIHYLSPSQVIPIIHCVFFFFLYFGWPRAMECYPAQKSHPKCSMIDTLFHLLICRNTRMIAHALISFLIRSPNFHSIEMIYYFKKHHIWSCQSLFI